MKLEVLAQGAALPLRLSISDCINNQLKSELIDSTSSDSTYGNGWGVLFVCGAGGSTEKVARQKIEFIESQLSVRVGLHKVSDGSVHEVRELDNRCAREDVTHLVAIGGGRVIDVAKGVKKFRNTTLSVVPTALSSDCIASPVVVLMDSLGQRNSMPGGMPDSILIETKITTRAPLDLTLSGLGDIISNASSVRDYREKQVGSIHTRSGFASILSEAAYRLIIDLDRDSLNQTEGHRRIAEGLVLSGLAMAFAGDSSPCSGGEHLISHALDKSGKSKSTHGLQVSVGTAFCMALRKLNGSIKECSDVVGFMRRVGLPLTPENIGVSREDFLVAARVAPQMRPGRVTILSQPWTESDFLSALDTVESWANDK